MGLGQYDGLGEYFGPLTASSMFLILVSLLAYIPLRCKNIGLDPQFCVRYSNMLVSKNAKICLPPNAKHIISVTPNAKSQREPMEYRLRWSPMQNVRAGQVHFMFLCSFHPRWLPSLQWNMGFRFTWLLVVNVEPTQLMDCNPTSVMASAQCNGVVDVQNLP